MSSAGRSVSCITTVTAVVSNLRSALIRVDAALVDSGDSGYLADSHFFLPP